jgi:3-oxoacyl-[acyl-carrier protein] reductase
MVKGDVAQEDDCQRIVHEALERFGRVDGLINSAGVTKFVAATRLDGLNAQDWQDIYAVNVIGAYQMIRACVPAMKKQGHACVVNISSMSGLNGLGSSIAYAASKGALNTLTLSLARALAPEIRVNAVCPGMIETRWHRARFDEAGYARFKADYESRVPLAKAATPEDVAQCAVWLMEGADQVTGEMIKVDGGFHLGKY